MRTGMMLVAVVLAGCAAKPPETSKLESYREIGRLVGRHEVVMIGSGGGGRGVVYSVAGRDGRLLAENVTLAELKERMPELGERVEKGTVWAGMEK